MAVTNTFEIFAGRLGGGKTYTSVIRIIERLAKGGVVATNVQLNTKALDHYIQHKYGVIPDFEKQLFILTEEQICDFYKYIPLGDGTGLNPLIVMDEFHLWFNSRDFGQTHKNHRPTLTFITQARKLHVDLLLISQSELNVDKQFIRQLHGIYRFRDMGKFVIPGLGIKLPLVGNYILAARFDQDAKTLIDKTWIRKDPQIFKCYETTALLRPIVNLSSHVVSNILLDKVKKPSIFVKYKKHLIAVGIPMAVFFVMLVKYYIEKNLI